MDAAEHLKALESELLLNTTRKNAVRVASLLADDFREFGSSGRVYSKDDIISTLLDESPVSISPSDFVINFLSEAVALVTYKSQREQPEGLPSRSLRSSIWVRDEGVWRMTFHQGTKLP